MRVRAKLLLMVGLPAGLDEEPGEDDFERYQAPHAGAAPASPENEKAPVPCRDRGLSYRLGRG